MNKPVVIDVFCCQGGATRGYQEAGAYVIGVDLEAQPKYIGDEFHQADAIAFLMARRHWIRETVSFIHASPPCQFDSDCQRIMGREHPDLIDPTRDVLERIGVPYVIENVSGARPKLRNPVELCGLMFGLTRTYRHRYFDPAAGSSFPSLTTPATSHPK